jgi:predicted dehydrogenase
MRPQPAIGCRNDIVDRAVAEILAPFLRFSDPHIQPVVLGRGGADRRAHRRQSASHVRFWRTAMAMRAVTGAAPVRSGTLRVALAGAGMISQHHLIAWSRLGNRAKVVAVADPDRRRAEARAEAFSIPHIYADLGTMLKDIEIDALDVASPRETHAANVEMAVGRGIDVLCQKPLAPTLAHAEALMRRVGDRARLMVHENWRFRPWYRDIKRWLEEGELGRPLLGNMAMLTSGVLPDAAGRRPALDRQPFMAFETRLTIAEVLIHQLDVVRWLMGPLRVIGARAGRSVDEVKGETLASIFMETVDGAPVVVTGTMAAPGFAPTSLDRFELIGTRASAALATTELKLLGPCPQSHSYDFAEAYQASFDGAVRHFVDCLETGAPFETEAADNLETLRLVEHAYWSAGLHDPAVGP